MLSAAARSSSSLLTRSASLPCSPGSWPRRTAVETRQRAIRCAGGFNFLRIGVQLVLIFLDLDVQLADRFLLILR